VAILLDLHWISFMTYKTSQGRHWKYNHIYISSIVKV